MQKRSIIVSIILCIVTCGLYGLYWMAQLNDGINALSHRQGSSGGMVVLLSIITCGIYMLYWLYQMGKAVEEIHMKNNAMCGSAQIVYLLLGIFGFSIVSFALMQDEINQTCA